MIKVQYSTWGVLEGQCTEYTMSSSHIYRVHQPQTKLKNMKIFLIVIKEKDIVKRHNTLSVKVNNAIYSTKEKHLNKKIRVDKCI